MIVGREPVLWQCLIKKYLVYTFQYREHYLFPECISSKVSLILSKGRVWVTNSSTLIFLDMYSVTSFGTLSTLFQPERRKNMPYFSLFHPSQKIKNTALTQALVWSIWKGTETSDMFVPPMVVWQKHTLSKRTGVDKNLSLAVPAFNINSRPHWGKCTQGLSIRCPLHIFVTQPSKFCIAWTKSSVVIQSLNTSINLSNYWIPKK